MLKNLIKIKRRLRNRKKIKSVNSNRYRISVKKTLNNINFRDFLRFSKVRDEFIINYFNNKLTTEEIIGVFKNLDILKLPVSKNDCMIIDELIDLKNNKDFIDMLLENLKNNSRNFKIFIGGSEYKICIDENNFRSIERLIIRYLETQTNEDFKEFVYGKTGN